MKSHRLSNLALLLCFLLSQGLVIAHSAEHDPVAEAAHCVACSTACQLDGALPSTEAATQLPEIFTLITAPAVDPVSSTPLQLNVRDPPLVSS